MGRNENYHLNAADLDIHWPKVISNEELRRRTEEMEMST